jgi:hypothetical protein
MVHRTFSRCPMAYPTDAYLLSYRISRLVACHIARSFRSSSACPTAHPTDRLSNRTFGPLVDSMLNVLPDRSLVCSPAWPSYRSPDRSLSAACPTYHPAARLTARSLGCRSYYPPDPSFVPLVGRLPNGCPTDSFSAHPLDAPTDSFRSPMACTTACPTVLLGERRLKSLFWWYWVSFSMSFQRIATVHLLSYKVRSGNNN